MDAPDDQIETQPPPGKIYTETAIITGSVFGGPLAAAYMYIANRKVMGKPVTPWKAWGTALASLLGLIGLGAVLPETAGAGVAVGSLFGIRGFVQSYHSADIDAFEARGGRSYPILRAIGIGIAGLIVTVAIIACVLLVI